MRKVFYARVSSADQNLSSQLMLARDNGIPPEDIYTDKQSGANFKRPGYQKMLEELQPGDILYVKSIDRLGRNYRDILNQWQELTEEKKVDIIVLDMPLLDTTKYKDTLGNFTSNLVLQIFSYQADAERTNIRECQALGIKAAKERGVPFGRPRIPDPENMDELFQRYLEGESISSLCKEAGGMKLSTFRNRLMERMGQKK